MDIIINGETKEVSEKLNLSSLISELGFEPAKVLFSLNGNIVSADKYSEIFLRKDDKLELFTFVGGG